MTPPKSIISTLLSTILLVLLLGSSEKTTVSATTITKENENNNHVIKLTDQNFEDFTQSSTGQTTGKWIVNFHSPNCGHCKNLSPIWSKFSNELHDIYTDSGVLVASVDVKENPAISKRFNIMALPTILFFADESMFIYPPSNERHVDTFVKFVLGDDDNGNGNGGYKEVEKLNVPKGPGGVLKFVGDLRKVVYDIEILRFLLDDVEHILLLRKNAAILLIGMGVFVGFLIASLLGLSKSTNSVKKNVKGKTKHD